MSTVLTNGIIIPDNGSRNWGGDLANNWNILDVNVGYMNDVKNSVATLENSVAENTANIQINSSNISALQTSKQDTLSEQQIANIADVTNKANDADVVHKSGNETISGVIDFTSPQKMKGLIINPTASIRKEMYGSTEGVIVPYGSGTVPESNINTFRFYVGKARNYASAPIVIDTSMGPTGSTSLTLRTASNESENVLDHRAIIGTSVTNNSDGTKTRRAYVQFYNTNEIRPNKNNYCDLGTSTNKWKSFNGINPGALSLPDCGESVDVTSQVVNVDGVFKYTNDLYDAWLIVTAFADKLQIANQNFECRAVRSADDVVTAHIPLRLNETASMRFANFTNFAYVKLFKCLGNV